MGGVNGVVVVGLAMWLVAGATGTATPGASEKADRAVAEKARRVLQRVPYYGVFDFLAFSVEDGTVTLHGYAHRPALRAEAEAMVRRATGSEVVNQIETLPSSTYDDRIRWATYQINSDDFADRCVSGGAFQVRYELLQMARFPGMEPYGNHLVHIIVKDRRVALIGSVVSESDKVIILTRARHVPNTTGIEDAIMVRTSTHPVIRISSPVLSDGPESDLLL